MGHGARINVCVSMVCVNLIMEAVTVLLAGQDRNVTKVCMMTCSFDLYSNLCSYENLQYLKNGHD